MIFRTLPRSCEMTFTGRPFIDLIIIRLVAGGVALITLHTGCHHRNADEGPQVERFEVLAVTARLVNVTKAFGGRVVVVGTTVTDALESAVTGDGLIINWYNLRTLHSIAH